RGLPESQRARRLLCSPEPLLRGESHLASQLVMYCKGAGIGVGQARKSAGSGAMELTTIDIADPLKNDFTDSVVVNVDRVGFLEALGAGQAIRAKQVDRFFGRVCAQLLSLSHEGSRDGCARDRQYLQDAARFWAELLNSAHHQLRQGGHGRLARPGA